MFDADKPTLAAWEKQQSEFIRQNSKGFTRFCSNIFE
jgi:hypothetical protein